MLLPARPNAERADKLLSSYRCELNLSLPPISNWLAGATDKLVQHMLATRHTLKMGRK